MATGTLKGIFATSYMADDAEIADSDWYFSQLEADFQSQIDMAETTYSGYDEYHYFLNGSESTAESLSNAMTHDPFQLISFLSVMYEDFNASVIQGEMSSFFHTLYQLDFKTITQTRYRTAYDEDGESYQEAYTYKILNTKLVVNDWAETIQPFIESKDGGRQYDEYINSGGNHQQFGTPFNFNWYGLITCHYGGRDNPTGANTGANLPNGKEMHTGLDIGVGIGTPIYSVMEGKITFAGWHDLYGYYVDVTDSKGNKSRYAHCSVLQVAVGQEVKRGQVLALSGDTGNETGAHLHLEIFLNGNRVNPVFWCSISPQERQTKVRINMDNYQAKLKVIDDKLEKNADKLELAKSRVTTLETEKQKLQFDRLQTIMDDYLPIIEELKLSPQELRDLFLDNKPESESSEVANEDY